MSLRDFLGFSYCNSGFESAGLLTLYYCCLLKRSLFEEVQSNPKKCKDLFSLISYFEEYFAYKTIRMVATAMANHSIELVECAYER